MAKSKLINANEMIAENVTSGFAKMTEGVVNGYKKVENGVVSGYTKIEDGFVGQFLTKDGESTEAAKQRLRDQNNG